METKEDVDNDEENGAEEHLANPGARNRSAQCEHAFYTHTQERRL